MEQFIEAVRRYPCLWNTAALEYRDQELKDAAWAEVMKETDLSSVKEVKLKWKKLRDGYRDALKRQSEGAAGGRRGFPWKYSAQMHFLQPHMSCRKRAGAGEGAPRSDSSSESGEWCAPAPRRRRASPAPPAAGDALALFFSGMCEATRRLPAAAQLAVKQAVFGAVLAAERALLQPSDDDDDRP